MQQNRQSPSTGPSSRQAMEILNNMLKYIIKLRQDGKISQHAFEGLLKQFMANFIENKISERIDDVFERYLREKGKFSIDRFMELWQ